MRMPAKVYTIQKFNIVTQSWVPMSPTFLYMRKGEADGAWAMLKAIYHTSRQEQYRLIEQSEGKDRIVDSHITGKVELA